MSVTLTYGQKIPEQGDRGAPLFQDLEDNFTRLDGHSHDGIDSPLLTSQAFAGIPNTILAANWVAYGPTGHYRQLVTMEPGFLFDTTQISFRLSTGQFIHPTIEKASGITYYIYSTDNSIDVVAVYGG